MAIDPTALNPFTTAVEDALNTGLQIYEFWKSTQLHPLADQWVAGVQDPFWAKVVIIIEATDSTIQAGTATADDVYFAQQAIIKLWLGYQDTATRFASLGPGYAKIIEQSYDSLTPTIERAINGMNTQIAQLGGISTTARLGVNASHFGVLIVLGLLVIITLIVLRRVK